MKVRVVAFGAMRDYLGGERSSEIDLSGDATVRSCVEALGAPTRLVFASLVDGEQADLDRGLHEGAEVTLMPPFSGG